MNTSYIKSGKNAQQQTNISAFAPITLSKVKENLPELIDILYSEYETVIPHWKSKKNFIFALSQILKRKFNDWDIDCFFVHYKGNNALDFSNGNKYCTEEKAQTCEQCTKHKWCNACPDIIIHRRNTSERLLLIETQLLSRNQSLKEQALQKIKDYITDDNNPYPYGLLINLAKERNKVFLQWLCPKTIKRQQQAKQSKIQYKNNYFVESYKSFKIPPIKTEMYIVGLLDILGTKNSLYNQKKENLFINILNRNYHLLDFLKISGMGNWLIKDEVIIKIYSDNIIFAQKTQCPKAPLMDFNIIRSYIATYQMFLLASGFASRGYITQGRLFINNSFVIGDALVKAHIAEENIVKFPRVVIDPELMKLLPDQVHHYPYPPDPLLKKDRIDGYYFLNYYKTLLINGKIWHRQLYSITQTIIEQFNNSDGLTYPKWHWVIKYHNRFCKNNNCNEFIIPDNFIRGKQREIVKQNIKND